MDNRDSYIDETNTKVKQTHPVTPRLIATLRAMLFVLVVAITVLCWTTSPVWALEAMSPVTRVSTDSSGTEAGGGSNFPFASVDGRYVAFQSSATNLVPGDTNAAVDPFVKHMVTGAVTRASTDSAGNQATTAATGSGDDTITPDGRLVVFRSVATTPDLHETNYVPT